MEVNNAIAAQPAGQNANRRQPGDGQKDGESGKGRRDQQTAGDLEQAIQIEGLLIDEDVSDTVRHAFEDLAAKADLIRRRLEVTQRERDEAERGKETHSFLPTMNRAGFIHDLDRLTHRIERTGARASLILVALENGWEIRVKEGRLALDDALKQIAGVISAGWVQALIHGCIGGGDFGLVVVEGGLDGARAKASRLAEHLVTVQAGGSYLKVRVGVVDLNPGVSPLAAVEAADRDLRRAGRAG